MEHYTMSQWLLFFYLYCFLGWVWESCYVSVRKHQWVNRGFLHGPLLPIYGSGAIIILWATLPVRGSIPLIFLLGMVAATVLEYCTGAAMEALFKVRYWDYSDKPFNLNGHICLFCSLGWGVFSVLLVKGIHPPIETLVLDLPAFLAEPVALVLTVAVTADAVQSFNAAMDLRELLEKLTESNEDIRRIQKRLEVYSTFAQEEVREKLEKAARAKGELEEKLEELSQESQQRKLRRREALSQAIQSRREKKVALLDQLSGQLELCRQQLEKVSDTAAEAPEKLEEIAQALERIRRYRGRLLGAAAKTYRRSDRILRGNPSAKAGRYAEALEELRKLSQRRK